jgi:DNA-binding MarR family transcriptional regulator
VEGSPGDLSVAEYRALAEFRYQIRRFARFSEAQARALGVEPQHHQLLLAIKGLPEGARATVGEISSRLQLRHHSTVELIDRLVERNLAERVRTETDRREVLIALTPAGEKVLQQLSIAHRQELQHAGQELSRALRKVLRNHESKGAAE